MRIIKRLVNLFTCEEDRKLLNACRYNRVEDVQKLLSEGIANQENPCFYMISADDNDGTLDKIYAIPYVVTASSEICEMLQKPKLDTVVAIKDICDRDDEVLDRKTFTFQQYLDGNLNTYLPDPTDAHIAAIELPALTLVNRVCNRLKNFCGENEANHELREACLSDDPESIQTKKILKAIENGADPSTLIEYKKGVDYTIPKTGEYALLTIHVAPFAFVKNSSLRSALKERAQNNLVRVEAPIWHDIRECQKDVGALRTEVWNYSYDQVKGGQCPFFVLPPEKCACREIRQKDVGTGQREYGDNS